MFEMLRKYEIFRKLVQTLRKWIQMFEDRFVMLELKLKQIEYWGWYFFQKKKSVFCNKRLFVKQSFLYKM